MTEKMACPFGNPWNSGFYSGLPWNSGFYENQDRR